MSASLTIEGSVYPAQSGTLIRFDRGITIQNVPAKRVAKFGDGYATHIPLGPIVRTYGVAFNNRPTTEIDIIETYFKLLKGEPFYIYVRGEYIRVVVLSFNKNYQNGEVYSLTANLKEVFGYDIYEMLSNQTAAALFDIDEITSLRVGIDGSGGVPVDGDPVGMMMDVSGTGGKTMAAYLAGATELVTNGTFNSNTSGWTAASDATLSSVSGELHVTCTAPDTTGLAYQSFPTVVGKWYEGTITKVSQDANSAWGFSTTALSARDLANFTTTDTGTATAIFQATTTTSYVQLWGFGNGVSDGTTVYDNVSIKELPGYAATAPSDAARPTLVGALDTTASELTDDGTRGEELFANLSAFADGTDVLTITGFVPYGTPVLTEVRSGALYIEVDSINEGARFDVHKLIDIEIGSEYEIFFEYSGDGSANVYFNAGVTGQKGSSFTVRPTDNRLTLFFRVNTNAGAGSGTFSNISVKKVNTVFDGRGDELVTNGTFDADTSGWSDYNYQTYSVTISSVSGQLNIENDPVNGGNGSAYQNLTTEVGKAYQVSFDLVSTTAGSPKVQARQSSQVGASLAEMITSGPGTYSFSFVAATTVTTIVAMQNLIASSNSAIFDNISVKEVLTPNLLLTSAGDDDSTFDTDTGNWTKGTGWSIGSGVASCDGTQTGNSNLAKFAGFVSNKWYRVRMHITSLSAGGVYINIGGITSSSLYTTTGWVEFIGRAITNVNIYIQANSTFVGSIDNVIIQEVPASVARAYYLDFDGTDDTFVLDATDFASSTNATLYKTFRGTSTDTTQIMFAAQAGPYVLAAQTGSTNTTLSGSVGTPTYREDGAAVSYTNRGTLFTALIDNTDHTIGAEDVDLSANSIWGIVGFYIGGEYSTTWDSTGRLYAWAAVDTKLSPPNRNVLEHWMLEKKT